MKSSEQVIMTFEPSDHQAQEIAHKKKLKRKKKKDEHKQQVSVVPDVDPVGNQPKNVVSPDSPRRDHEEKNKKGKKKRKKKKNKSGENVIDPKEEESLNLNWRKLIEAAMVPHVDPANNQPKNIVSPRRDHEDKSKKRKKKKRKKNKSGENVFDPKAEESLNFHHRKLIEASMVPDIDPVGNQPKDVVSPCRDHEDKSKKRKKKKNTCGENVIDPKEEESLNFHRRKLIEAAMATHETAKGSKEEKKRKKKKKCDQGLQKHTQMQNSRKDVKEDALIHSETSKSHYMKGLGLELANGVTMMIKNKANKKKKRQEEQEKLKKKHVNNSVTKSCPLHKVMKRKLSETHEEENPTLQHSDESQVEKRPKMDDDKSEPIVMEKNAGERKKKMRRKKKKKLTKNEPLADAQEHHLATQIESIQSRTNTDSNSIHYDETEDQDPVDDPDPVGEDFFPTGDEVADDDISVFMDEEEKAIKKLQRRNHDALAMLRSTNNICKRLKGIVPQACPNLRSKPTNEDDKESMLNNLFEWPDISKNKFPILHKVIDWIFTKESFVVPSKYSL